MTRSGNSKHSMTPFFCVFCLLLCGCGVGSAFTETDALLVEEADRVAPSSAVVGFPEVTQVLSQYVGSISNVYSDNECFDSNHLKSMCERSLRLSVDDIDGIARCLLKSFESHNCKDDSPRELCLNPALVYATLFAHLSASALPVCQQLKAERENKRTQTLIEELRSSSNSTHGRLVVLQSLARSTTDLLKTSEEHIRAQLQNLTAAEEEHFHSTRERIDTVASASERVSRTVDSLNTTTHTLKSHLAGLDEQLVNADAQLSELKQRLQSTALEVVGKLDDAAESQNKTHAELLLIHQRQQRMLHDLLLARKLQVELARKQRILIEEARALQIASNQHLRALSENTTHMADQLSQSLLNEQNLLVLQNEAALNVQELARQQDEEFARAQRYLSLMNEQLANTTRDIELQQELFSYFNGTIVQNINYLIDFHRQLQGNMYLLNSCVLYTVLAAVSYLTTTLPSTASARLWIFAEIAGYAYIDAQSYGHHHQQPHSELSEYSFREFDFYYKKMPLLVGIVATLLLARMCHKDHESLRFQKLVRMVKKTGTALREQIQQQVLSADTSFPSARRRSSFGRLISASTLATDSSHTDTDMCDWSELPTTGDGNGDGDGYGDGDAEGFTRAPPAEQVEFVEPRRPLQSVDTDSTSWWNAALRFSSLHADANATSGCPTTYDDLSFYVY